VFKAAVVGMADVTAEVLKRNEVAVGDLAWLVPHQANGRIIEAVAKRLGLGLDRVIINLSHHHRLSSTRTTSKGRSLRFSGRWSPAGYATTSPALTFSSGVFPSGTVPGPAPAPDC
jgi:hypothetical protein